MQDSELIGEWFDKYSDDIYYFLIYRIGIEGAEDLVQEAFIRAIKRLETFKGESNPKYWLLSIARNLAIDEIRKRNRLKWISLNSKVLEHTETPEELLTKREINKELYQSILLLKQDYRDVLILKGLKEMSVAETAVVLNWKESKVRLTYHRAKKALEKELGGFANEKR